MSILAEGWAVYLGHRALEGPIRDTQSKVDSCRDGRDPTAIQPSCLAIFGDSSTHHKAQPHQPLMLLIGTAVVLEMILTILPQAISAPMTKARFDPANQWAYSLLWVDSMTAKSGLLTSVHGAIWGHTSGAEAHDDPPSYEQSVFSRVGPCGRDNSANEDENAGYDGGASMSVPASI
jgi:hypothetical protein